ncbi:MAG: helix-turn-helix domain-containing protein [Acidimicrobiales bacterium]
MTGRSGDAATSRRSSADHAGGAEEVGHDTVLHVKGVATVSHILGRKWTTTILIALTAAPVRHGPLCRKLSGISRKVLHESLNALIEDGLVEKVIGVDDLDGVSVSYGLTPLGRSLAPVIAELDVWCAHHLDELTHAGSGEGARLRVERSVEQGDHPEVTTVTLQ